MNRETYADDPHVPGARQIENPRVPHEGLLDGSNSVVVTLPRLHSEFHPLCLRQAAPRQRIAGSPCVRRRVSEQHTQVFPEVLQKVLVEQRHLLQYRRPQVVLYAGAVPGFDEITIRKGPVR